MARDSDNSFIEQYESLVKKLASERFDGDDVMARLRANEAIFVHTMNRLNDGDTPPGQSGEDDPSEELLHILGSGEDLVARACKILDWSGVRIRQTAARDAGAVYTPPSLARFICQRTVESYLLRTVDPTGKKFLTIGDLIGTGSDDELLFARDILRSVRLLDSSCGTGVFLEASLEELCKLNLALSERLFPGTMGEGQLMTEILERNLFGMDIEAYSVMAARMRLTLRLEASRRLNNDSPRDVRMHLFCGNALLPEADKPFGVGFDLIVGNPPYMRVKSMFKDAAAGDRKKMKTDFSRQLLSSGLYRCQEGNLNLYKLFIERNLSLLKENGSMGLIFPSSFLTEATSVKLRKLMFSRCDVEEIVELPEKSRAFGNVSQATAIVICHKGKPGGSFRLRLGADAGSLSRKDAISIDTGELEARTGGRMEVPLLTAPDLEWTMLRSLSGIPPFKGNESFPPVGDISVGNVDETIDREYIASRPTGNMFVKGIHLREYDVDLSPGGRQPRWIKKEELLRKRPSAVRTVASPRIIGRNTQNKACSRRLKFALLPPGYVCGNSIKQIVVTDRDISPLYLLALLNSSVLNWHFEIFCSQNNIRNYSIEALPIPRASRPVQEAFAFVAKLIMSSDGDEREFLDKELMDAMAYELYFMDMRMLSSAVLSSIDQQATTRTLKRQDDIRAIVSSIVGREGFKVVQRATYRRK